tara:strand:+ start:633 stop:1181 length:549 start_codon:yes stop_codon:yes gene_type:complete
MRLKCAIRILLGCHIVLITHFSSDSKAQVTSLAINYVIASERLHTAGQPSPTQLSTIADLGFDLVINLAPPSNSNAVTNEAQLVAETGLSYLNIPVNWENPSYADFELFSGVLNQSGERKVLVHCILNYRASIFTFLYRTIHENVPAAEAFKAVVEVWEPERQWVEFGQMVLNRNQVDFKIP